MLGVTKELVLEHAFLVSLSCCLSLGLLEALLSARAESLIKEKVTLI